MTAPRRRRLKAVFEGRRDQLDRLQDTRIEDRDPRVFAVRSQVREGAGELAAVPGVDMKKIMLAGVAALSIASTAHAGDALVCGIEQGHCKPLIEPPHRVLLPKDILGRWCHTPFASTEDQVVYFRPSIHDPERSTCSDLTDGIYIDQKGYDDESPLDAPPSCVFDKIEQKGEGERTYVAQVHCTTVDGSDREDFRGREEFQLINGLLFKKRMQKGLLSKKKVACYEVQKTSDNFLALRERPSAKSNTIWALREGYALTADDGEQRGWARVRVRRSLEVPLEVREGWVFKKYIKEAPCK